MGIKFELLIMKQSLGFFFFLAFIANAVTAQEPIASAHCYFDEESLFAIVENDDGNTDIFCGKGGDLDDIVVNAVGVAPYMYTTDEVKLTGDAESSAAGRSLVIHEDHKTNDARLKCCTIIADYIPPKQEK